MKQQARIGDWVSFYLDRVLVIGEVRYVKYRAAYNDYEVCTDKGSVPDSSILEIRSKVRKSPGEAMDEVLSVGVCPECGEPQYKTPSGVACVNGHGF